VFNNIWNKVINPIFNDAPEHLQIAFQDGASPGYSGIIDLHDSIFFYLVLISVGVFWILGSVIINFSAKNSPIVYKYSNHGTKFRVPTLSNIQSIRSIHIRQFSNHHVNLTKGTMINKNPIDSFVSSIITYNDLVINKRKIFKENKDKSGIYRFTNLLNGKMYIGSSSNLSSRFRKHLNLNYISQHKNELSISRAIIKYGYDNFSLEILEFCEVSNLLKREQFYLNLLEPVYNIAKVAGSNLGFKHSKESRAKISKALKGSPLLRSLKLGTTHTKETKKLMSISRSGERNPHVLFRGGKSHTEVSKDLIRKSRIGKTHSKETILALSMLKGTTVYLYEINIENKYVRPRGRIYFILI